MVLGFFVPYFERLVIRLPTPPCSQIISKSPRLVPAPHCETYQIHRTTDKGILHTRTILGTSTTNLDNTVLLNVVACKLELTNVFPPRDPRYQLESIPTPMISTPKLTFTRNVGSDNLARTQANSCNLTFTRVRLLGLGHTSLNTDTLKTRRALQRRRTTPTSPLTSPDTPTDLVVCSLNNG